MADMPHSDSLDGLDFVPARSPEGTTIETRGLRDLVGRELRAAVVDDRAVSDAQALMVLAAEELLSRPSPSGVWWSSAGFRRIRWSPAEDWFHGEEGDGERTRPTIQRAAADWGAQHWVCTRYEASFAPISEDSLVAIAPSALQRVDTEGSRYEMTGDNSGWIIIDESFTGSARDLPIEHAAHVADRRPNPVRYFALPVGWRFFAAVDGERVEPVAAS